MLDKEQSKLLGGLEGSKIFPSLVHNPIQSPLIAKTSLAKPLKQLHTMGFSKPSEMLQISSLKRPEYLAKLSPKALSPQTLSPKVAPPAKAVKNLDLEDLDRCLNTDILEPLVRDEGFTRNLEVQTKLFEEKIEKIVENDTYLEGFRNVEVKRNKNPNSLNMYAKDFEMKMAKIEDSLEKHINNVGEQILLEDENRQEEYEKSKRYNPMQGVAKLPKTFKRQKSLRGGKRSPYSEIKEINLDIMREKTHHKAGLLPKLAHTKLKLDPEQQVKQDTFLTAVGKMEFINRDEVKHPVLDELSSINEQNFQFSSVRSQPGDEFGDIMNLKRSFMANMQALSKRPEPEVV